jgi:hypothetical protein
MRLKIVKDDKSLDLLPTTALQLQLDSPLYLETALQIFSQG